RHRAHALAGVDIHSWLDATVGSALAAAARRDIRHRGVVGLAFLAGARREGGFSRTPDLCSRAGRHADGTLFSAAPSALRGRYPRAQGLRFKAMPRVLGIGFQAGRSDYGKASRMAMVSASGSPSWRAGR